MKKGKKNRRFYVHKHINLEQRKQKIGKLESKKKFRVKKKWAILQMIIAF